MPVKINESEVKKSDETKKSNGDLLSDLLEAEKVQGSKNGTTEESGSQFQPLYQDPRSTRYAVDSYLDKSGASTSFPYCPKNPVISIGFHHKQFISVSNADEDTIERVVSAMKFNYCKGVRRRIFQTQDGVRRIELYGMPFQPYFMDHFTFVYAVMLMLKDLLKAGYAVIAVANIGQGRDMFVWFLRKQNFQKRTREHQFGLIELLGRCKIRTYGNIQDMIPEFEEILKDSGNEIVEKEAKYSLFTSVRVDHNIWDTKRSSDTLKSKMLLTNVLRKLEQNNFCAYTSLPLDRKRSSIIYWKNKDGEPPKKSGFMISLMRKNRIVVTDADSNTLEKIQETLATTWKKKVTAEDPMLCDNPDSQTYILEGNPFGESSFDTLRDVLDLQFALLKALRIQGWVPSVNLHMITNNIDKSSVWFTYRQLKESEFCALAVEDTDKLRAYKVPECCIDNLNTNILDCVLPVSQKWTSDAKEEYEWQFEEALWVSASSQVWKDEDTLIEKGHAVLCAIIHSMMEENYHPIMVLNMPPSSVVDDEGSNPVKNLCTFFFAKDDPHFNSELYPLATDDDQNKMSI